MTREQLTQLCLGVFMLAILALLEQIITLLIARQNIIIYLVPRDELVTIDHAPQKTPDET